VSCFNFTSHVPKFVTAESGSDSIIVISWSILDPFLGLIDKVSPSIVIFELFSLFIWFGFSEGGKSLFIWFGVSEGGKLSTELISL